MFKTSIHESFKSLTNSNPFMNRGIICRWLKFAMCKFYYAISTLPSLPFDNLINFSKIYLHDSRMCCWSINEIFIRACVWINGFRVIGEWNRGKNKKSNQLDTNSFYWCEGAKTLCLQGNSKQLEEEWNIIFMNS